MNGIQDNRFQRYERQGKIQTDQGEYHPPPDRLDQQPKRKGSVNLAPFSYFSMLGSSLMSVSFIRQNNVQKDTARNILRTGEAVVHIADRSLIAPLDLSSKPLLAEESEVELTGMTLIDSTVVQTPGIKEAKIRMEARLEKHLELDNFSGGQIESDLLILRVLAIHLREDIYNEEKNYIDHKGLDPLARLGGPYFAGIDPVTDFERQF